MIVAGIVVEGDPEGVLSKGTSEGTGKAATETPELDAVETKEVLVEMGIVLCASKVASCPTPI